MTVFDLLSAASLRPLGLQNPVIVTCQPYAYFFSSIVSNCYALPRESPIRFVNGTGRMVEHVRDGVLYIVYIVLLRNCVHFCLKSK